MLTVAMWIDERGSVEWAEIYRSSGHEHLDESALELFQEVVSFLPARERGVHVPMAVVFGLSYPW
jgi:TonB family protein